MKSDFVFRGGAFVPIDDVAVHLGGKPGQEIEALGYRRKHVVGDDVALCYCIRQRDWEPTEDQPFWVVDFMTIDSGCYIVCETWPDLIALLSTLSPIVSASLLTIQYEDALEAKRAAMRR